MDPATEIVADQILCPVCGTEIHDLGAGMCFDCGTLWSDDWLNSLQ